MRWRPLSLTLLLAPLSGPGFAAGTSEQVRVLATVQALLDAWRNADPAAVDSVLHPDFREVTLHEQDGKWKFDVVDRAKLVETVGKIEKGSWDDRLIGPTVHVAGQIAAVWSPYRFTVRWEQDGKPKSEDHCGIENFQLYKAGTEWRIVNFADTHSDACAP